MININDGGSEKDWNISIWFEKYIEEFWVLVGQYEDWYKHKNLSEDEYKGVLSDALRDFKKKHTKIQSGTIKQILNNFKKDF